MREKGRLTCFRPGEVWMDEEGKPIQAHGGGVLYHDGVYYWFGENKDKKNTPGARRVDVIGVSCYSSVDLYNWKHEGIVLPAVQDDIAHDLHPGKVLERPKVIYNRAARKFIMWMHVDTSDYTYARIGIAVSGRPAGPYEYIGSIGPNGFDSRDMTLFKDEDERAYVIFSSEMNSCLQIALLTDDYLNVEGICSRHFKAPRKNQSREAPAIFKDRGKYYLITSGCTGWNCNEAEYAAADSVFGPWEVKGNPCIGEHAEKTFYSQPAFVLPLAEKEGAFIFMGDRWFKDNLRDSRYVWLPVFPEEGKITIKWMDSWEIADL